MLLRNLALVACVALTTSGCYVRARVATPHVRVVDVDSYEPEYYDDNVVYYENDGRPYYYHGDRVVFIERNHPRYGYYHNHWRSNRAVYSNWHSRYHGKRIYRRGDWRGRVRVRHR